MQTDDVLSQIEEHFHVVPLGEKSLDFGKILSSETSVKVLEAVYNSDTDVGVSATDVSGALGVGRTTVIYHLGRMQESGLITINPVLKNNDSWTHFWDLYRRRNAEVSKEQFNQIHAARMNGVKLYVPTKKGFLVLPSTDVKESRTMVKEVLSTITSLAIDGSYRKLKKTNSVLGTLGVLFIAMSFAFQMPFFQNTLSSAPGPLPLAGESTFLMEDAALDIAPEISPSTTVASQAPSTPPQREKSQPARSMEIDSASGGATAGEIQIVVPELMENKESLSETLLGSENPTRPASSEPIRTESTDKLIPFSKALFYVGILLVGSFLGFLIYTFIRKK